MAATTKKINFYKGHPSNYLLPTDELIEATKSLLSRSRETDNDDEDRHPLTYGPDPGSLSVRTVIAKWLQQTPAAIQPDCLNLTNGASFGIGNALQALTSPLTGHTKRAFIVSPTYFLINSVFLDAGFGGKMSAVLDVDGLDLAGLEKQILEIEQASNLETFKDYAATTQCDSTRKQRIYRYVFYCVPNFANPSGHTMTLDERKQLLKLARKYDILILCDDIYDQLNYDDPDREHELPRIVTLDRESLHPDDPYGHTISNSSFSKLLGPGLRVGWQETAGTLATTILARTGPYRSGGTPAHYVTYLIGEMFALGLVDPIIKKQQKVFASRVKVFKKAILDYLPSDITVTGGSGGYFFWVVLNCIKTPEQATKMLEECRKRGVILAPGNDFKVVGSSLDYFNCVRLSWSWLTEEEILDGVKIWGEVLKEIL